MAEMDLVNYWNNFLKIAFDNSQKAMLTTCTLQSQNPEANKVDIKCCFSFTVRRDAQHNIKAGFAKRLIESLENNTNALTTPELHSAVDDLTSLEIVSSVNSKCELDKLGTALWNLTTKQRDYSDEKKDLLCLRKVLKCTIKAAKYSLDRDQLSLAEVAVEKASIYEERLRDRQHEAGQVQQHLLRDYLLLRIALAWRQGRLDMAKLMYSKVKSTSTPLNQAFAEQLADLLFEVAKDQSNKSDHAAAVDWFEDALDELSSHEVNQLSSDGIELKMCTMHYLVKAHINVGSADHRNKAWNVVQELELEYGQKLTISLLKLDLYASEPNPQPTEYASTLEKIVRTVHLTEINIKTVLHHLYRLRSWSSSQALNVLLILIKQRLLDSEEVAWLEKGLVTMVWIATSSSESPNILDVLKCLFDEVVGSPLKMIGSVATHTAQMLMWKSIESYYQQQQYEVSKSWCHLSLHNLFKNAGARNVGKLQRKLILCALDQGSISEARDIHADMSTADQDEPASRFLMYKIALRRQDGESASQCLESICKKSNKDPTILYACVLEAQRSGDQIQSIAALQRVLEDHNMDALDGVHLPALLRCTARQLFSQLEKSSYPSGEQIVEDICKLFEGAVAQARKSRKDPHTSSFTIHELDWFSRNSYNLSLKHCSTWSYQYTQRTVTSCLKFIEMYPTDQDLTAADDLNLRRLFCYFLSGSLLTAMARQEDLRETQLQQYLDLRKAVDSFRVALPDQLNRLGKGPSADLQRKFLSLLAYDFEAAARLKAWNDLQSIIKECETHGNAYVFSVLADIVLASEAPAHIKITTLQQIINGTWAKGGNDISKLSRWIRCLFSLAQTSRTEIAEQLLEQAIGVVQSSKGGPDSNAYPAEELEWLATMTFNHAIDFHSSGQEVDCRRWAEQALRLADLAADNGALHHLLQEKYQNLSWQKA
ncbi:uncharacterized protein KY384_004406 [Bacidia gigantensis]|uniref:uncharacterized protein n=1 Tax=Bacidia gigantensis TaxID=2732470 RepID=UPI001D04BE0C|nr:uncharacterized protein KY384_004406 [Bacidia gigantensis]KAG8531049.1 hypothetical protein KY384_004406 [Bacidia gigantensis]